MKFTIYQGSRNGPRPYNHDRVAYSYSKDALLAVLADGLGSKRHAELAARISVKMITDAFQRAATPDIANPFKFLGDNIRQIHDALHQHAQASELLETPRTTIVAAIVQHDWLYCAHAGDSRLYHFREGSLLYRTEDHSKVQMMFRKGELKESDMLKHPERNKIYSCLGSDLEPQIELGHRRILLPGDTVLICSDGLWSMVGEREFSPLLRQGSVTQSVPKLLDLAESRCGKDGDNMSAIAFTWGGSVDEPIAVSTATMPLNHTTTIVNAVPPSEADADEAKLTEDEIDKAIAEIQAALRKIPK